GRQPGRHGRCAPCGSARALTRCAHRRNGPLLCSAGRRDRRGPHQQQIGLIFPIPPCWSWPMASDTGEEYRQVPTAEALDLIPTGLFIVTAAHDGQDNWQFVQRGLGITAGPPTIVLIALSPGNRTTELLDASGQFGFMICSLEQGRAVRSVSRISGHNVEDK